LRPITFQVPFGRSTFIPAGCFHWPISEKDLIEKWVRAVAEAPNGFTILMGDTQDCARTHFRDHIRGYRSDQNSQEALDAWSKKDVADLAKLLMPIKKKIIGAIRGNHYAEYLDGTNSEQYLCQLLEIPYLGPMGVVRLEFMEYGRVMHQLVMVAHHNAGSGGGRTAGGDVNAMMRMEGSFEADIYVVSHTHQRHARKEPILTLTRKGQPKVQERCKIFIRSGAFLKGFKDDYPSTERQHVPSYAEEKAYRPTDLGWVTVTIDLKYGGSSPKNRRLGIANGNPIKQDITISF